MQMIDTMYMATISRAISQILQRINQHFQKLLLLHVKRLAVLSLHFKLHLIKKKVRHQKLFSLNNLASVQIAENISSCGHKNIPLLILILGVA